MIERKMPDFEQTLQFYEDFRPHIEKHLDSDQHLEFACLCISDYFRNKAFDLGTFLKITACIETHAHCSTFQPHCSSQSEKISLVSHRLTDVCRRFLTQPEAESAILEAFLRCASEDHALLGEIDGYLNGEWE